MKVHTAFIILIIQNKYYNYYNCHTNVYFDNMI